MTEPFVLDRDVPRAVVQVRAARVPAVQATVVEATGSTPQDPGARLLVLADGQQAGTVGGGLDDLQPLFAARLGKLDDEDRVLAGEADE